MGLTEPEELHRTVDIAPRYLINVTRWGDGFRADAPDFPEYRCFSDSAESARALAFHSIFTAVKFRLMNWIELPPMTLA